MGAYIPERLMTADKRAILIQPNLVVNANSQVPPFVCHRLAFGVEASAAG